MNDDSKHILPPIGITMGCPAGIGPEIIIKYFHSNNCANKPESVVIGDTKTLTETAAVLGLTTEFSSWEPGAPLRQDLINVLEAASTPLVSVAPGRPDVETGTAMAAYIEKAVELCLQGSLSGITTCPISKATLNAAGYNFPGHTEFLCNRTGAEHAVMMMAGKKLNITLATIHCSLASVPSQLSQESLEKLIVITDRTLKIDFNISEPVIAVAGLNPHAGEDTLFGNEEKLIITPAVNNMAKNGILVQGPFPPDTIFHKAASGNFNAVVCMYHDQGLIPFKLLHFDDGVNVTLGLPIVRTSVDHGTAYDIAGKGLADYRSLEAAVVMAAMIAANRSNHEITNK